MAKRKRRRRWTRICKRKDKKGLRVSQKLTMPKKHQKWKTKKKSSSDNLIPNAYFNLFLFYFQSKHKVEGRNANGAFYSQIFQNTFFFSFLFSFSSFLFSFFLSFSLLPADFGVLFVSWRTIVYAFTIYMVSLMSMGKSNNGISTL